MKLKLNDEVLFEVNELHVKCLSHGINKNDLMVNIKEMAQSSLKSACEGAIDSIKKEWIPKLFERVKFIPTDEKTLLDLIFSQPDYKDKYQKDCDLKADREAKFEIK